MKRTLLALALLGLTTPALAASVADAVTVDGAFVRAAPPGTPNTAAYMTLKNGDAKDHALTGAANPASKTTELHTHVHEGGMMMMRQVPRIELKSKQDTRLDPGGLHVRMIGLTKPLKAGDTVPVTLRFEDGSSTTVDAPVKMPEAPAAMPAGHGHGQGH